jgi:hypothetical protein
MISDLLSLHAYFDGPDAVLFYKDLLKHYDTHVLQQAIDEGILHARKILIGPDKGHVLVWMDESALSV